MAISATNADTPTDPYAGPGAATHPVPNPVPRRIALVSLPLSGHLTPMGVLADALRARGHRVVVVGPPGLCALAQSHMPGIATHPISDGGYGPERLQGFLDFLPQVRGLSGIRRVINEIADLSALYARQLPAALGALGADTLVHDQLEPAAGVVAKGLGLAHASLAAALPMNRDPHMPPPYLGWPYSTAPWWRSLYGGGYLVVDRLMAPQGEVLAEAARQWGLPARTRPSDWVSESCDLAQLIPGFDYPRSRPGPDCVGPLRRKDSMKALEFERDGRDLVFCSLGTLMGGRRALFEAVARACADHVVQLVVAHGGRLGAADARYLQSLPGQPVVRDFVDQAAVLSEARACVLHGGLNTVLDAGAHGVPMVLLPLAFEQGAIAARAVRSGAAVRVARPNRMRRARDVERMRKAVGAALELALNSAELRAGAARLARASALAGGVAEAVRRIEALPRHAESVRGAEIAAQLGPAFSPQP